jgi:sensor domain CHASE-containing protein
MSEGRAMISLVVVVACFVVVLTRILAVNDNEQDKQDTVRMVACVENGGAWTISPENDSLMECTK